MSQTKSTWGEHPKKGGKDEALPKPGRNPDKLEKGLLSETGERPNVEQGESIKKNRGDFYATRK